MFAHGIFAKHEATPPRRAAQLPDMQQTDWVMGLQQFMSAQMAVRHRSPSERGRDRATAAAGLGVFMPDGQSGCDLPPRLHSWGQGTTNISCLSEKGYSASTF